MKYSATHGIRTRYLRTIISCWLADAYDFICTVPVTADFPELAAQQELETQKGFSCSKCIGRYYQTAAKKEERDSRQRAVEVLSQLENVVILTPQDLEATRTVYVWMGHREFEALTDENATALLQLWADQIQVPEEITERSL